MEYARPYGETAPHSPYVNGDPSIGRRGSIPPAEAIEHPQREIVGAIAGSGQTPSSADLLQLWRTHQIAPWTTAYGQDTGVANALVVALDPVPLGFYVGMTLRVKAAAANTGPTTIAVNGMVPKAVRRAGGADLQAADLKPGMIVELVFDGSAFQMVNYSGVGSGGTTNNYYTTSIPYAPDTGGANAMVGNYTPAITALAAGNAIEIKAAAANTGPTTIAVNALAPIEVRRPDGQALSEGDIVAGMVCLLIYDGTRFQLYGAKAQQLVLSAPRTYYVNGETGNDNNTGLTAGAAFATLQKAVDAIARFDLNGFNVTVICADYQSYAPVVLKRLGGSGTVEFRGNIAAPASCRIHAVTGAAVTAMESGYVFNGFRASSAGAVAGAGAPSTGFWVGNNATLAIRNIELGACATSHMAADNGVLQILDGILRISGSAPVVFDAVKGGVIANYSIYMNPQLDITIAAAVTVTDFVRANVGSLVQLRYNSLSGAGNVAGRRYNAAGNSVVATSGGGASYWPGTIPGALTTGGQYL